MSGLKDTEGRWEGETPLSLFVPSSFPILFFCRSGKLRHSESPAHFFSIWQKERHLLVSRAATMRMCTVLLHRMMVVAKLRLLLPLGKRFFLHSHFCIM
mmetsp:Transcript_13216/g.26058  ORF Transcript_13216/g.26058 Transcript_13216/m.26058 type:complete len:99 (-) Transcript_13216:1742-2038(-)